MPTRIAVIYYSSTSHVYQLASAVAAGAEHAGAEVRLRRAPETAPEEAIASNPAWQAHLEATKDVVAEVELDDLDWADGFAFGTPARYGLPAGQLKQFLDSCSPLWLDGKLKDKAATAFTSSQNPHGGQESTILALSNVFYHWGALIVPPDSMHPDVVAVGGNPYGTSYPSEDDGGDVPEPFLKAARLQGERLAHYASRISAT